MFCKILDNKIIEASSFYGEKCFDLSYHEFISKPEGYYIYDEITDDIILNPNYENEETLRQKEILKAELQTQLDVLDKKRIRAICEPSVRNTETGETWLEFYNTQVFELRNQVMALE